MACAFELGCAMRRAAGDAAASGPNAGAPAYFHCRNTPASLTVLPHPIRGPTARWSETMSRYSANLPSVGLATFMKSPVCEDLSRIDADVAVLGIPYDSGTGFRPGSRF